MIQEAIIVLEWAKSNLNKAEGSKLTRNQDYLFALNQYNLIKAKFDKICNEWLSDNKIEDTGPLGLKNLYEAFKAGQNQSDATHRNYNAGYHKDHPNYDKTQDIDFNLWIHENYFDNLNK